MTKEERQSRIMQFVGECKIRTQAELTRLLAEAGVEVDQSTLSRDLTELGIGKSGGYYGPRDAGEDDDSQGAVDYASVVRWFTPCGPNMIVISTRIGQAQPVALEIEGRGDASILATLAGDDTIYVTTRTRRTQSVALRRMKQWFGDKQQ